MIGRLSWRLCVEASLAAASAAMFVVTLAAPSWIETALGYDPDRGSGAVEWLIVAALVAATCTFGALARAEWTRTSRPRKGRAPART